MNIPEMNIEMKQGLGSESVVPAKAVQKPPVQDGSSRHDDAVLSQSKAKADQSARPSREELTAMIAEAEKHLDDNDVKLKFNVLENNDTIQVEVIDSNGKTIRKIPEDDLIKLTKSLKNLGQGFLDEVS